MSNKQIDDAELRDLEQWAGFDLAPNDAELVNALIGEVRASRVEVATCQRLVEAHQGVAETARRDLAVAYDEIGTLKARIAELERQLQDRDDAAWDRSR